MEQVYKLWKMKAASSSAISKSVYYNGSYLLLFGKKKLQNFPISWE